MSTPTGPPSRGRLALALTAAAAAAAPAAPAAPAPNGTRQASGHAQAPGGAQPSQPTRPAPAATSTDGRPRLGPVIVEYAIRPAAYDAPREAERLREQVVAPAPDLDLVKVTPARDGIRLAVDAGEPGLLRVSWAADGAHGTEQQTIRGGRTDVRLDPPPGTTHVRVHATLVPSSGGERATTHAGFRLRR